MLRGQDPVGDTQPWMFGGLLGKARRAGEQDELLREATAQTAEASRAARAAVEEAEKADVQVRGLSFAGGATPSAAQRSAELAADSARAAERAAFLLDVQLKVAKSTSTYRPWQQIPSWVLGGAGVLLAFVLAFSGDADAGGWVIAALMLCLAVIASFRGPADLRLGTGGAKAEEAEPETAEPVEPETPAPTPTPGVPAVRPITPTVPTTGLRFYGTGLDYTTRRPLVPALAAEDFDELLRERMAANADELERITGHTHFAVQLRGERERVPTPDLGDPRVAGWSFLVDEEDPDRDAIIAALRPLAELREMKDPAEPLRFQAGASWSDWLTDNYQAIDPRERPYYVMIVGGPERVPFHFQALLDSTASAGRVAFDTIDELTGYVEKVVRLEDPQAKPVALPEAVFFAPDAGPEDATYFSRKYMATPLSEEAAGYDIAVRLMAADEATKANLQEALDGARPGLVYTASHGIGAPDQPLDVQRRVNGAICCQATDGDWLFTADDVPDDDTPFLEGGVFFQFACYGYGTPAESDFMHWLGQPTLNAEADFVAALPKRLLAHPRGPIAYIGHVDTAWLHGFDDPDSPLILDAYHERLRPFITALNVLLTVQPAGLAMTELNKRFDLLNGTLAGELDRMGRRRSGLTPELMASLANTFVFRSDAQNYALFGDPGARVRLPQA